MNLPLSPSRRDVVDSLLLSYSFRQIDSRIIISRSMSCGTIECEIIAQSSPPLEYLHFQITVFGRVICSSSFLLRIPVPASLYVQSDPAVPQTRPRNLPPPIPASMVFLAMTLSVMFILQKHVLVATVCCKSHGRNAQAREGVLEPIPPAEEACVAPFLAVRPQETC